MPRAQLAFGDKSAIEISSLELQNAETKRTAAKNETKHTACTSDMRAVRRCLRASRVRFCHSRERALPAPSRCRLTSSYVRSRSVARPKVKASQCAGLSVSLVRAAQVALLASAAPLGASTRRGDGMIPAAIRA
eukprot:2707184-Pleurochrysis_carterae.AAC.2